MTREEAIQILADLIDSPFLHTWEKQNKALHMAIEALSAPQTDLINRGRADAIEAVAQQWLFEASVGNPYVNDDDIGEYRKLAEELFEDVPSADAVSRKAKCCPIAETCMSIDCPVSSEYIGRPSAEAEWIPCSERLPDNDDWVLGTVRYWDKAEDPIDEAFYAVEHLFYDGKWRIAGGSEVDQYDDATVLAWQPMPEPYKGDVEKPKERKIPLYAYASWDRSEE